MPIIIMKKGKEKQHSIISPNGRLRYLHCVLILHKHILLSLRNSPPRDLRHVAVMTYGGTVHTFINRNSLKPVVISRANTHTHTHTHTRQPSDTDSYIPYKAATLMLISFVTARCYAVHGRQLIMRPSYVGCLSHSDIGLTTNGLQQAKNCSSRVNTCTVVKRIIRLFTNKMCNLSLFLHH